jgi:methionine sulfoxide reductase heme-binding subunit
MPAPRPLSWLTPSLWAGLLLPIPMLAWQFYLGELGANPIEAILNQLGSLALISLIASLACTPAQRYFKLTWPARIRKHLGLISFTYVTLHLVTYVALDQRFDVKKLTDDLKLRPFLSVGFLAWVLLIPLAVTSFNFFVRKMGFVWWKRLHRLSYVCAILGIVHFVWREKKDITEPLIYGAVLAVLLATRLMPQRRKSKPAVSNAL